MKKIDIEQINRNNFKSLMNALSKPAHVQKIEPLFDSFLVAISSVLLYSQVSFYYSGKEDIEFIKTMCNAKSTNSFEADYIFADSVDNALLKEAKVGTLKEPEFSSTLIFTCKDFSDFKVLLSGPGIDKQKEAYLPIDEHFIQIFEEKNSLFPLGNDIFFLNKSGEIVALSRTTTIRRA